MKNKFDTPTNITNQLSRALRKIAASVGTIVDAHVDGVVIPNVQKMTKALQDYADTIEPWAYRTTSKLINQLVSANERAWTQNSLQLSNALRSNIKSAYLGNTVRQIQERQVNLIKSLPIEAGQRAQKLALEAATDGTRNDEIAKEIANTSDVTKSRATLIARTETAKANAAITQVRAQSVGVNQYIWRATGSPDSRESHEEMSGQVFNFNEPPVLSDGTQGNPGEFPNCQCYAEPLIVN